MCWNTEPYQELEGKELCQFCGDVYTDKMFCSEGCAKAFYND